MRLKKVHILLLKSFVGPLLLTFFISMFILMMQFLWKYLDDLVGKGLDFMTIIQFLWYASWSMISLALPLSVLLSSLMVFGNLGEHYELVALKSSGISFTRIMAPLVIVSIFISGFAFYFSNYKVPEAYVNYRKVYYEIRTKKPTVNIREGEYYNKLDGYVIRIGKKHKDGKKIENVQIYDHTDRVGNVRMTMAKSGNMETGADGRYLLFQLFDGYSYTEEAEGNRQQNSSGNGFTKIAFKSQVLKFDLSSFEMPTTDVAMFKKHEKGLDINQLSCEIDTLSIASNKKVEDISRSLLNRSHYLITYYSDTIFSEASYALPSPTKDVRISAQNTAQSIQNDMDYYQSDILHQKEELYSYQVEWHKKFSLAFVCLVLFFIGAPLGSIIRKGGLGMPVVMSVLLFIAFHVLNMIGEKAALKGEMVAWMGLWLAPLVFLPFGFFLVWKANTDSPLLDWDSWRKFFSKK